MKRIIWLLWNLNFIGLWWVQDQGNIKVTTRHGKEFGYGTKKEFNVFLKDMKWPDYDISYLRERRKSFLSIINYSWSI